MKFLKNYSLSLILGLLFLGSWFLQALFGWQEFQSEQQEHNKTANISDYQSSFLRATFENWQSEFLQLFTFVVLAAFLIHKGSPQSKDGDDQMKAQLNRIELLLKKKS